MQMLYTQRDWIKELFILEIIDSDQRDAFFYGNNEIEIQIPSTMFEIFFYIFCLFRRVLIELINYWNLKCDTKKWLLKISLNYEAIS